MMSYVRDPIVQLQEIFLGIPSKVIKNSEGVGVSKAKTRCLVVVVIGRVGVSGLGCVSQQRPFRDQLKLKMSYYVAISNYYLIGQARQLIKQRNYQLCTYKTRCTVCKCRSSHAIQCEKESRNISVFAGK